MPRTDKPIFIHKDVFEALREAKVHFEGITKTNMTWSAYLYALACGALAVSSLIGLKIRCPVCGDSGMQLFYSTFEAPGKEPKAETPPVSGTLRRA